MRLILRLPRDPVTVPATRHTVDCALDALGVTEDCRDDVGLALSEACANVVRHAEDAEDYTVMITATGNKCTIEVHDDGAVAAAAAVPSRIEPVDWPQRRPGPLSESGRGLNIVRAVMDAVHVGRGPGGVAVRMVKRLIFGRGALLRQV
jgi:serine/threonine-protein kinase RsbW